MKKAMSIILALCLLVAVLSLAGCQTEKADPQTPGDSETQTTPAPETQPSAGAETPPAGETPAPAPAGNDIQARLDAGEYILVGFSLASVDDEMTLGNATSMQRKFAELGIDMQYFASGSDISVQITQIENLITMGAVQIIIASNEPSSLQDACKGAMDAGIQVVFSGEADVERIGFEVSGANAMSGYNTGVALASMALHWVGQTYPDAGVGEIHVGILTIPGVSMSDECTQAYYDTFGDNTPCQVTYESPLCITTDNGYDAAQEGLTFDPAIRVFLGFTESGAIGASNYICSQGDLNVADFAAFSCGAAPTTMAVIDTSANNEAAMRGLVLIGDPQDPTAGLWKVCYELLFGITEAPYYLLDNLSTYNSVGYEM